MVLVARRYVADMAALDDRSCSWHRLDILRTRICGSGDTGRLISHCTVAGLRIVLLVSGIAVEWAVLLGVLAFCHTRPRRRLSEPREEFDVFRPDELTAHGQRTARQRYDDEEPDCVCGEVSNCVSDNRTEAYIGQREPKQMPLEPSKARSTGWRTLEQNINISACPDTPMTS